MTRRSLSTWTPVVVIVLLGCSDEFTNNPPLALMIDTAGWRDTVMVGDQAVFGIRVSTAGGQSITGVQVTWESDKPAKLEVLPLPAGGTTEDSLSAQLSAVVRAYARDSSVTITATVDRPGFERDVLSRRVVVMERWLSLGAGKSHTCGIVYNHEAYCWGNGQKGALGNGQTTSDVPDKVLGLGDFEFESISAGEENTCGIIIQRLAYCWGSGSLGRLGNGSQADRFFPTEVSLGRATLLMRAGATTCAISTASEGFCWGNNALLQLGVPVSADTFDRCGSDECSLTPRGVRTASDAPFLFSSVDVGTSHVCGISKQPSSTDRAFCWGSGTQEPLTLARVYLLGDTVFSSRTPRAVAPPLGATVALAFRSISAGDKHACGITTAGVAYCWGWNGRGQLGTGLMTNEAFPKATTGSLLFDSITVGSTHSCALSPSGNAYCWGANDYGQLGVDSLSNTDVREPRPVLGNLTFASLSAGYFHTCGITMLGAMYCWGRATDAQLGTEAPLRTCTVSGSPVPCSRVPLRVAEPRVLRAAGS